MALLPSLIRLSLTAAGAALLGGCAVAGDIRAYPEMAPVVPVAAPVAQPGAGAIYAAGPGLNLYGDRRARDVGDLLTITLVESTTASTTASTASTTATASTAAARRLCFMVVLLCSQP